MPTILLQRLSQASGVSAKSDFQYFFFADHTSELIPPVSVSLTLDGSDKCSSDKTLQQFPHFQDYTDRVHSLKSLCFLLLKILGGQEPWVLFSLDHD